MICLRFCLSVQADLKLNRRDVVVKPKWFEILGQKPKQLQGGGRSQNKSFPNLFSLKSIIIGFYFLTLFRSKVLKSEFFDNFSNNEAALRWTKVTIGVIGFISKLCFIAIIYLGKNFKNFNFHLLLIKKTCEIKS